MSFNVNYVFSKAIDDASTFGGGVAQNGMDLDAERSLSNFDRRHVLTAAWWQRRRSVMTASSWRDTTGLIRFWKIGL